ncbi:hypothetical protein BpHYR1_053951 [Brachionus plicatilis]|uniref:Uncharacterized protein n=1 Tax=Brachionus plicatilis TaxID=10195 RepID=A0A3M7SRW1_BRAPC|nr:hypothetical protein BpHYR1_053951 [Brachionus plicatilis]
MLIYYSKLVLINYFYIFLRQIEVQDQIKLYEFLSEILEESIKYEVASIIFCFNCSIPSPVLDETKHFIYLNKLLGRHEYQLQKRVHREHEH